jgi:diguanylate cyclase (GGDEF)-like protein/putative nucleotidyltransferase with HDIG domain
MQNLRWQARVYIWCTIFAGVFLYTWRFWHLKIEHPALLVMLSVFAAITHTLRVEGATSRSSYQISWIAYGASFVLLEPPEAMILLLVAHIAEWIWHKPEWYGALFNVNAFGIVANISIFVWQTISDGSTPFAPVSALAFLVTAATFTALNHLMVGLIIWLAHRENLMRSGVFHLLTLMIDFVSFGMGIASGLIWLVNPYAVVFILSPLYLIYTTLQVPSLQQQTRIEPKTGLYNAKYFAEALKTELERADRFARPLTIVMADVDLLRNINNTYGHLAGDTVLIGIANTLRQLARDYDVVSRFGGEEFAILMPETSLQEALPRIEQMRAAIDAARFEISTSVTPLSATMSFGVAEREHLQQTAEEIIHNADLAVYQSKATTRNRVCYFVDEEIKDFSGGVSPLEKLNTEQSSEAPSQLVGQPASKVERPKPPRRKLDFGVTEAKVVPSTNDSYDKPIIKTKSQHLLRFYLISLTVVAIVAFIWSLSLQNSPDWVGIIIFTILTLLTEGFAVDIYARNTSVSTAVAPIVAGACLFGATGALILTLTVALASLIKHRSPLSRLIFNASNHLLGALICVNFIYITGVVITDRLAFTALFVFIAAAILNYLITSILISGVVQLSSDQLARNVWFERFYWLWPYYIVLGFVAYALALGYLSSGVTGVLVFLVPLLMLRISQNQYLSRTESMVVQLRTANTELIERSNEISAMNEGLILALSHASDLRDPFVHGHALHVVRYAVLIAEQLGLSAEQIQIIRHAGLLHDIGKIGIPETILFKPAKLSKDEYELMKQHAVLGAALVREIESLQHLAPFIRHHHEHYNGCGYPAGLSGKDIPLEARILAVADAVEAMASDRPYRKALTPKAILEELQKHSSTQFDPLLVDAFIRVVKAQGEALIVNSASNILKVIESGVTFDQIEQFDQSASHQTSNKPIGSTKLVENLFSSELDSMNMALHKAFAAHRRMELNAQEGRELAETLLKVASTINTTLEQDRVLALILEQLAQVVQYDNASIMLIEGENLNAVARRSIHTLESQFLSVRTGKLAHVSEVIEYKRAVVITDTENDSRWMRRQGSENIRCWLGVPLIVQDRVIGLLNLSNSNPGSYTDHHLQVSVAFAAHAAIAISNARLYTQAQQEIEERERAQAALRQSEARLQERVSELQRAKAAEQKQRELAETLSEAAHSMSASLNLAEVVHTVVTYLSRLVASDRITIKLIDGHQVELFAFYDKSRDEYSCADGQFPLLPMEEFVVTKAKPHLSKSSEEGVESPLLVKEQGALSWLGVPLMVRDKVIGLLTLSKDEANYYSAYDVNLVAAFANQSAITITNARLYQQVQNELMERMRAEMELQEERALLAQRVDERTIELKTANTRLTSALRTKDEFLATVSHELRTPLSAILLLTESMQNGVYGALADRHSDILDTVKHSARHLLSLINDILDMSKIESGMFELDMGPVSLPIICRNSLQFVQEAANKKQIELVQKFDQNIEMVNGDERRLLQILVNLLSNAVKFTPDGGQIGLEVVGDSQREMIDITVWDTGIGIAKEDIARLFQPFVQLDSKLSRQYEGTGLGLALVDRLTKMHGGSVVLESEVGKGSRFIVSIPWQKQDAFDFPFVLSQSLHNKLLATTKMHGLNGHGANGNGAADYVHQEHSKGEDKLSIAGSDGFKSPLILLVEDNEIGIEAMHDYLTAHDYRVIVARNGEEAISQTNQCRPDLILMDIQMPDMDGLEATTRIRRQDEFIHIPIIALTALAMPGDRERCMQAGANEYLSKPVSMKQLVTVIQSHLAVTTVHVN